MIGSNWYQGINLNLILIKYRLKVTKLNFSQNTHLFKFHRLLNNFFYNIIVF